MPEHVHLLITEPPTLPLGQALASIKREVSRQLPQSPFWLPRYYDFNIFTNEKRIEKLRYIHRNPVHRGLVANPEDYEWSSYRDYARLTQGPVQITANSVSASDLYMGAPGSDAVPSRRPWEYSFHFPHIHPHN